MPIFCKLQGSNNFVEYENARLMMEAQSSNLSKISELELRGLDEPSFKNDCVKMYWAELTSLQKITVTRCECHTNLDSTYFVGLEKLTQLTELSLIDTKIAPKTTLSILDRAPHLKKINFDKKYPKFSFSSEITELENRIAEINRPSPDLTGTTDGDLEPAIWEMDDDESQSRWSHHRSSEQQDSDAMSSISDSTDSGVSNSEKMSIHFNSQPQPRKASVTRGDERSIRYRVGDNWVELDLSERISRQMYGKINELEIVGADANAIAEIDFDQLQRLQSLTIDNSDIQNLVLTQNLPKVTAVSFNNCDYNEQVFDSFVTHCPQLPDGQPYTTGSRMVSKDSDDPNSPKLTAASLSSMQEELKVRRKPAPAPVPAPTPIQHGSESHKDDTPSSTASFYTQNFEEHDAYLDRHRLDDEQSSVDESVGGSEHGYDLDESVNNEESKVPNNNWLRSTRSSIPQHHQSESRFNGNKSKQQASHRRDDLSPSSNRHRYYQPLATPPIPADREGGSYKSVHFKEQLSDQRMYRQSHGNPREFDTWVATDRNTEIRSLDQIEADINNALQKHGLGKDNLLQYDLTQHTDSTGSFVRLVYENENQQQVPLLDADHDSVSVYKSWNKQGKFDLSAKALIVLGSLGIPPCPKEGINFEKGKNTPLGMEVDKQFKRLQKKELRQENDIDLIVGRNRPRG